MSNKIAIIGLGYVGLPLAVEFAKQYDTIGYDINSNRIDDLKNSIDKTLEVNFKELKKSNLKFSNDLNDLTNYNIFIITVPTPIDQNKRPDFEPLKNASKSVGSLLKKGDIVIYESTVFPGATEEICVQILEKVSNLKFNTDFYCGYSPERINPGDKKHTVRNIKKITSGSTPEIADKVDKLYLSIITAGTYKASSIKVAEAAKVIENTQRDINIAFINELAQLFNKLNINTFEVLEAAATKWNFLNFKPGLVGGHCIGVDPYYLTYKAQEVGHNPEIILAGRRINDQMAAYIASEIIKKMINSKIKLEEASVLILGITFKENCPDIRNTKVIDLYNELKEFGLKVEVFDPNADAREVKNEYNLEMIDELDSKYEVVILAVAHNQFMSLDIRSHTKQNGFNYDIKNFIKDSDYSL